MTRTTMRWTLAVGLAATAAGLAPAWRAAEAAPSSGSPFAGSYEGTGPELSNAIWRVDITGAGKVTGTNSYDIFGYHVRNKLSGTVSADGAFSYRVDTTVSGHPKGFFAKAGAERVDALLLDNPAPVIGSATLTKNGDGSVTGTSSSGMAIVWNPR
jgi:hypothetical protein